MAGPNDGALGAAFKFSRGLQAACLITIIGLTANFINQIVAANAIPPQILIATLSIVCIAVLYCTITFILYHDNLLPHLVSMVFDALLLIALVVVSVVVGKPVSYLNCNVLDNMSNASSSAYDFTSALGSSLSNNGGKIDYSKWIGTSKATCLEIKSIWGLSMALCVLFTFSGICSVCLWRKAKQGAPAADKAEA